MPAKLPLATLPLPRVRPVFPATARRRGRSGRWIAGAATAVLAAGAFTYLALWVESDRPLDEPAPARGWHQITQPVAEAVQGVIRRQIREKVVGRRAAELFSEEETLARFFWPHVSEVERGTMAYRLARLGTPRALAALQRGIAEGTPAERARFVQELGTTGNPAVKPLLFALLADADPAVALAALRGLANFPDPDVAARVEALLAASAPPEALRVEAATVLGQLGTAPAREALVRAWNAAPEGELAPALLEALGKFAYSRVASVFEAALANPALTPELKATALEALAQSSREAAPALLRVVETDATPELREAAAWALSAHGEVTDLGPTLTAVAAREPEADVRRRVYEALLVQAEPPLAPLTALAAAETDSAARVAALNALAAAVAHDGRAAAAAEFDRQFAAELAQIASAPGSLNLRMRAVFALRRAGTAGARQALLDVIAATTDSTPALAEAAAPGLTPLPRNNPKNP